MRPKRDIDFVGGFGMIFVFIFSLLPSWSAIPSPISSSTPPDKPHKVYIPVASRGSTSQSTPHPDPYPPPIQPQNEWLAYVNSYRSMANLPPVIEEPGWNNGGWLHSRYMVKNDVMTHGEDPQNAWYTTEGDVAGKSSNLTASGNGEASDLYAIDSWMQAPFHAVAIIDPALNRVGFGSFREPEGNLRMGATLDVLRGRAAIPDSIKYPIIWPGNGATVPLGLHWGEYPDPLSSCPGYSSPSGLPLIVQLGPGNVTPNVSAHSFRQGNNQLEHCVFDETNYANQDTAQRDLGRNILNARDALVLIPRQPLQPGASYSASITANGQTYTWTFSISANAKADVSFKLGAPADER